MSHSFPQFNETEVLLLYTSIPSGRHHGDPDSSSMTQQIRRDQILLCTSLNCRDKVHICSGCMSFDKDAQAWKHSLKKNSTWRDFNLPKGWALVSSVQVCHLRVYGFPLILICLSTCFMCSSLCVVLIPRGALVSFCPNNIEAFCGWFPLPLPPYGHTSSFLSLHFFLPLLFSLSNLQ